MRGCWPFRWFTADEEFGQNPGLRDYLESTGPTYVMAIPKNTAFTDSTGAAVRVNKLAADLVVRMR